MGSNNCYSTFLLKKNQTNKQTKHVVGSLIKYRWKISLELRKVSENDGPYVDAIKKTVILVCMPYACNFFFESHLFRKVSCSRSNMQNARITQQIFHWMLSLEEELYSTLSTLVTQSIPLSGTGVEHRGNWMLVIHD